MLLGVNGQYPARCETRLSAGPRTVIRMATLVSFHAHPDDECISCGGVMRKAADEGHRVVLVVATRGEHGEVDDG